MVKSPRPEGEWRPLVTSAIWSAVASFLTSNALDFRDTSHVQMFLPTVNTWAKRLVLLVAMALANAQVISTYFQLLRSMPASRATLLQYTLSTIVTGILAPFLGETVKWRTWAPGVALMILGSLLITTSSTHQKLQ